MTKGCLERAYELARSGRFTNVSTLKRRLKSEGFSADREITGSGMIRSLSDAIKVAKGGTLNPKAPPKRLLTQEERSDAAKRGAVTRSAIRQAKP